MIKPEVIEHWQRKKYLLVKFKYENPAYPKMEKLMDLISHFHLTCMFPPGEPVTDNGIYIHYREKRNEPK